MIRTVRIPVTTSGADGAATGEGYSDYPLNGLLRRLEVDWDATAPGATSDIVVTVEADERHPEVTLYSKSDAATDVVVHPMLQAAGTDGNAIDGVHTPIPVAGRIKVAIAGCNALDPAATVHAYVSEE